MRPIQSLSRTTAELVHGAANRIHERDHGIRLLQPAERHRLLRTLKRLLVVMCRSEDAADSELPEYLHSSVNSVAFTSKPHIHHDQTGIARFCQRYRLIRGNRDTDDLKPSFRKRCLYAGRDDKIVLHNQNADWWFGLLIRSQVSSPAYTG